VPEYALAIVGEVLVQTQPRKAATQQARERRLARFDPPAMRMGSRCFERLRLKPSGRHVFLYAFDLLELDGQDLRREP